MKLIRNIIGFLLIMIDKITGPIPVQMSQEQKNLIKEKSKNFELFQFNACPFCIKVRRFMRRNHIIIRLRDAKNDPKLKKELLDHGGKSKVPCLKITKDNKVKWLYESNDIIHYLKKELLDF